MKIKKFKKMCEEYKGYCTNCKKFTRDCTEPDATGYDCPRCKKNTVMGAEQAMIEGYISFD